MRLWWILVGLVAVIGVLFWLNQSQLGEEGPASSAEQPPAEAEEGGGVESPPSESPPEGGQEPVRKTPEELLADLKPYLCEGVEEEPLPEADRSAITVAAACVRVEGLFMFGSRLPQTGDYLLKIWPTSEYLPLITACGALSEGGVPPSRELIVIVRGEDWPKVEPILQPEGRFRYAISVRIEGPYVYSTETNRHVYTPHCEIRPLQLLIVEEPQGDEGDQENGAEGKGEGD